MTVGGITQEVTVSATPPTLRTADGRLGETIRNEVYTALPLVMNTGGPRDPTQFMFLMPGVQSIGRWGAHSSAGIGGRSALLCWG